MHDREEKLWTSEVLSGSALVWLKFHGENMVSLGSTPLPPLLSLPYNHGGVHLYSVCIEWVHGLRGEYSNMLSHAW